MAATAEPPTATTDPLEGFSSSVRRVAARLGTSEVGAPRVVGELLNDHPEYAERNSSPFATTSPDLPVDEWLARVRDLFDLEAVARTRSRVVDTGLTILALGRLVPDLGESMRSLRITRKVERGLGFRFASVLRPWALPLQPIQFVELQAFRHSSPLSDCALSADGRLLVTTCEDGSVHIWDTLDGAERATARLEPGWADACDINGAGLIAVVGADGAIRLWDSSLTAPRELAGGPPLSACAFSPDGSLLAVRSGEGFVLRDVASGARTWGLEQGGFVVFGPDGELVASPGPDGGMRLSEVGDGAERLTLPGGESEVRDWTFSADGRLLAAATHGGELLLWTVESGSLRSIAPPSDALRGCVFAPRGRYLLSMDADGSVHVWDAVAGVEQSAFETGSGDVLGYSFSRDGALFATGSVDGTARVWEQVEPPRALPQVAADLVDGDDLVGVGKDAAALANVIAASGTQPPLSIGLFGDWGAGKTFLIGQIQRRVRAITRRSRGRESAYCENVRNIVFNAWQYADANLWASIVTHIFEELAKPEEGDPGTGVNLEQVKQRLAADTDAKRRVRQAQERTRTAEARKRLLSVTSGLAGAGENDGTLADLRDIRSALKLLRGSMKAWVVGVALTLFLVGAAAVVAIFGTGWIPALVVAATAWVGVAAAWVEWLRRLIGRAGETARVVDVRTETDEHVERAREDERLAVQEEEAFRSGQRLARFVAERGGAGDYRSQLGLVSQIHRDFERMSDLLRDPPAEARGELKQIDRIVLYIDDLDRCEPHRVVEVLKAVHLILAVELFVVVIAVDPRWLLSSLRLHYSELFGVQDDEEAWRSSPLYYLEKIIQVPFALRPMGGGVESLVHGLMPVERARAANGRPSADGGADADEAQAGTTQDRAPTASASTTAPSEPRPGLSPRTLALTPEERDFAVTVAAAALETPRTVKKFTNLYRLLRAGLDDGELDALLDAETGDLPEYRAVLILLALVIAFPDEASEILLGLGELAPDAPEDGRPWAEYVARVAAGPEEFRRAAAFLAEATPSGAWTREPFRRWALEVSRYSFATGQEVFAEFRPSV